MRRRFLCISAAVVAWPALLRAQPARKPARIGVLSSTSPEARSKFWDSFKSGMAKLGWVEGRDLAYVYRYARGEVTRYESLAAELVAEKPDLLYASVESAVRALKKATREIPIVFGFVSDPVASGLVASLRQPGGNVTGIAGTSPEMRAKGLELLREIRPALRAVAVVVSNTPLGKEYVSDIEHAARPLGVKVVTVAANPDEIDQAVRSLAGKHVEGVLFQSAGLMARQKVAERMSELKLPAIYPISEFVVSGGLLSYGANLEDNLRRAAGYADRILKGAKPADLPVEQPEKFDLVVNLKTARALGIKIPQSILLRATRVIE